MSLLRILAGGAALALLPVVANAQPPFGPGGPMGQQERKIVKQFDKDGDGRLNAEERKAAREFLKKEGPRGGFGPGPGGRPPRMGPPPAGQVLPDPLRGNLELSDEQKKRLEKLQKEVDDQLAKVLSEEQLKKLKEPPRFGPGPGGPGGFGREPGKPGPKVSPTDVKNFPDAGLYEPTVLRTFFLEFENKDWEDELADFKGTDVEVPATLVVDGKKYPNVGVHFRGMSSYMMTGAGSKRSLNLSMDLADSKQRLYGSKTLNLLNSAGDPTMLSSILYSHIARKYLPAPKANFVKVVINGESWGVYANLQQFNKEFLTENFKTSKGARWKVRGRPNGSSGLEYTGDDLAEYKRRYQIKSNDDDKDWKALANLCKVLNKTPVDELEKALEPILDIDGVLKFLALDVVLQNSDGYWTRASDFSIYRDGKGKFHIIPHDMNEAFQPPMMGFGPGGPGGPGGPRASATGLDPLVALEDARKPLRSKLLAVPSLKARYLKYVKQIAEEDLDWKKLGPVVAQYRKLAEKEIEADTRKVSSFDAFKRATADTVTDTPQLGRGPGINLRTFAEQRRKFLLEHAEIKKLKD